MASNHNKKNNGGRGTTPKTAAPSRVGNSGSSTRPMTPAPKSSAPAAPHRAPTSSTFSSSSTFERKPTEITRQQIAETAYFLWQKNGGNEVANWLEAERILKARAAGGR